MTLQASTPYLANPPQSFCVGTIPWGETVVQSSFPINSWFLCWSYHHMPNGKPGLCFLCYIINRANLCNALFFFFTLVDGQPSEDHDFRLLDDTVLNLFYKSKRFYAWPVGHFLNIVWSFNYFINSLHYTVLQKY